MVVLTDEDLERVLSMPEAMAAVEQVLAERQGGSAVVLPRMALRAGEHGLVFTPGALAGLGVAGLRVYPVGTPSDEQLVAVWNLRQGTLEGLVLGSALGALRTGAIGGVAAALMAAPDASVVGVIGAGRQARTQLLAIRAVRPISRVTIYRRDAARREEMARKLSSELGLPVEAAPSPQAAVAEADIVVTATPSPEPVLRVEWLKPGAHVNSLGPKYRGRSEIGLDLVEQAEWLVSDFPEQYRGEVEFILHGTPHMERLRDLAELYATRPQRPAGAITLFLSHGLPGTEVAVAAAAFRRAVELGVGRRVDGVGERPFL